MSAMAGWMAAQRLLRGQALGKICVDQETEILIVEDEPVVRTSIVAYLEDRGFQTTEAVDGPQALRQFRDQRPDVVLCDLRLPGMDGLEVLSAMTQESPETPVIIVSGANRMSDAIQALKRGAWDYIAKPITDLEILDTAVARSLDRARLLKENRAYQSDLEQLNRELTQVVGQLREDEEAARTLQIRMLPQSDQQIGSFRFRHRIFTSMYLSGDFVDFFRLGNDEVAFYMADVSGHGAASAFVTVMLKTLIDKYRERLMREGDHLLLSPSDVLSQLNKDFCQSGIDKYLTIFYAVLDRRSNHLRYCSGGQFPPPMVRGMDSLEVLTGHDRPVGLFEDSIYTDHEVTLPSGFILLLISDGILELLPRDAARKRASFLLDRVAATDLGLEALIEKFALDEVDDLPDDISFLLLSEEVET